MKTTSISSLRKSLTKTINHVIEHNEPIMVTTKKGNVFLVSEEEYNAILETIYLSSIPGLVKQIKEGEKENIDSMKAYK